DLLVYSSGDACFACLFDGLKNWWSSLSMMEKGAIALAGFAITFPLLGFWSAFGAVTTATWVFSSGNQIANVIRNPKKMLSPEYAMAVMFTVGLSRIPGGRAISGRVLGVSHSKINYSLTKRYVRDVENIT